MAGTTLETELSDRKQKFLEALLVSPTVRAAAKKVGITERTGFEYLADPVFARGYRAARQAVYSQHLGGLTQLMEEAIKTLKRGMKCKKPAVEVRAAAVVVDMVTRGVAIADLQAEMVELRALLAEKEPALPGVGPPEPTALPAAESETESTADGADALNLED